VFGGKNSQIESNRDFFLILTYYVPYASLQMQAAKSINYARVMQQKNLSGLHALEAITALLRRVRRAHPTKGLFEAADFQWWWRTPRPTDALEQLFWFDESGLPQAAVILTDWGDSVAFDPLLMPDATPEWITHVLESGFAHAGQMLGLVNLNILVDSADEVMLQALGEHGYTINQKSGKADVETWLEAEARPSISPIAAGYRLFRRSQTMHLPHHMTRRGGLEVEARLLETSLYRADLDLVVLAEDDSVAAYGLFWYDPDTKTGLVEPMRTEVAHQRKGLARHVLTSGLELLAQAGAERIKIGE
jgi:hypothetical protein